MGNTLRDNIYNVLSGPEREYFMQLCRREDDEQDVQFRHIALEHGVRVGGNAESAIDTAKLFLLFLRGEDEKSKV